MRGRKGCGQNVTVVFTKEQTLLAKQRLSSLWCMRVCVCVEFHHDRVVCVLERDKERWRLSCERQLRRKKKRCCKERWRQQLRGVLPTSVCTDLQLLDQRFVYNHFQTVLAWMPVTSILLLMMLHFVITEYMVIVYQEELCYKS